jgi:hypothetical protein
VTPGEVKAIFEPKSVVPVDASGVKARAGMNQSMIFRSVIHDMLPPRARGHAHLGGGCAQVQG